MPGLGLNLIGLSLFRQFVISLATKKHAGAGNRGQPMAGTLQDRTLGTQREQGANALNFAGNRPRQALSRPQAGNHRERPPCLIAGALARLTGRRRRVKERRDVDPASCRARYGNVPQRLEGALLEEWWLGRRRGVPLAPRLQARSGQSFYFVSPSCTSGTVHEL